MKNIKWFILAAMLVVGAGLAHAEGMNGGMMMGHGMMGMDHKMMGSMMQKQVIATSDGGVVVVSGDTMTKYDKNLNLVKVVELKGCKECMKKMGGEKGGCPMMNKAMMGEMKGDQDGDDDDVPAKVDAHAVHHAEKN